MAKKKTENVAAAVIAAAPEPAVPKPRLQKLTVRNFRAIGNDPVTLDLDDRTLLWAALRLLSEQSRAKKDAASIRPHILLMDEPELCLHPNAVREACRVLYDLPKSGNWQVMVTTHSPVFIDFWRDNTSIVRVERKANGSCSGTTIYRPKKAHLDNDDKERLKLLNLCDPYVAEFFFGGRTILVEGDTEYTAFT